ncbi:MAG: GntR family transcriptional regulator [Nitrospinota bacterium]
MAGKAGGKPTFPNFDRVRPRPMSRAVAAEIREAVLTGRLAAGQRLVEKDLTATFGVSRTSVREAFKELEAQGYISLIPHKGAFVGEPTEEEIRDLYAVASVLEGLAARLAAVRMTDEDLARLRAITVSLETCRKEGDVDGYYHHNHLFHRTFVEASGNARLLELVESVRSQIVKTRILSHEVPDRLDQSMREHKGILSAFLRRDPVAAEKRVVRHLENQERAFQPLMTRSSRVRRARGSRSF